MQEDHFSAAERILLDIETVLKKDPKLKEFDILPVKINQNKSPVVHVDHCMGLESWCLRHVYCYVYRHILDSRQLRHRREDPATVSRWLMGALLINPDVTTFWNMRRQLILSDRLNIESELHLSSIILSRKPKSAEAFAYRKWLSERLLLQGEVNVDVLLEREFSISECSASRYQNNYHAWTHRSWCMNRLAPISSNMLKVCLDEWYFSEDWMKTHISDHSGLHYRQLMQKTLFRLILAEPSPNPFMSSSQGKELPQRALKMLNRYMMASDNVSQRIDKSKLSSYLCVLGIAVGELDLNEDLILMFIGHEALWCHRRFLLTSLIESLDLRNGDIAEYPLNGFKPVNHKNREGVPLEKDQRLSAMTETEDQICQLVRDALIAHESSLVNQYHPARESYQETLSGQHRNWMTHVLQVDLSA